ncbi:nicotinate (nicotinamide) nucleotide adenylyltransferase [Ascidiimonas aurantiaca]|uniref:nicotinate (nicotinamide) nucleotide adenylyltransferase n=1 Tax=Ascidiimonas aurantiaca TaxID=1685432 RepID=UPI0030EB54D4
MKKVGLYFGTFNPIHVGHLIIANHMVEFSDLEEVWLVVTPHNPVKKKSSLLEDHHRYQMVWEATKEYSKLKPSNIEFNLPQPNYTVKTLLHLQERYPHIIFSLIMGEDNLKNFHKWKNYEAILENHHLFVYPRISKNQIDPRLENHSHIHYIKAPVMEISSTFIRKSIGDGKNIRPLLPEAVWKYLDEMNFYKKK